MKEKWMKKILALAVIVNILSFTLSAQDTTHTLLKLTKPHSWGIYVAPEVQYGQVKNAFTSFGGGSAMLMINNRFAFGVTAQQSMSNTFSPKSLSPLYVQAAMMGGKLEFTPHPTAAIHVTFPLMVGMGEVSADSLSENNVFHSSENHGRETGFSKNSTRNSFVVIQPGINVEANLLPFMKLFVGANYRFSILNDNNSALLTANTLQGLSISAGAKVGIFDHHFGKHKKGMPVEN
jgi:hypothetical protein